MAQIDLQHKHSFIDDEQKERKRNMRKMLCITLKDANSILVQMALQSCKTQKLVLSMAERRKNETPFINYEWCDQYHAFFFLLELIFFFRRNLFFPHWIIQFECKFLQWNDNVGGLKWKEFCVVPKDQEFQILELRKKNRPKKLQTS